MGTLGRLVAGASGESKRIASEGCDGAGEEDCLKKGEGMWLYNPLAS